MCNADSRSSERTEACKRLMMTSISQLNQSEFIQKHANKSITPIDEMLKFFRIGLMMWVYIVVRLDLVRIETALISRVLE